MRYCKSSFYSHLSWINMDAAKAIKDMYSLEDLKEIADHGCQSGVCRQHIYYGDTIKFYEKYEGEILDYITDCYGDEFLVETFKNADACLDIYKNNIAWCFIEMIAMEAVEEHNYEYAMSYAQTYARFISIMVSTLACHASNTGSTPV